MPTIDVNYSEFEKLLGKDLHMDLEEINDVLAFVKGEAKAFDSEEDTMIVEIKDTNRPDSWNVEGLARACRGFLGIEEGLKKYEVAAQLGDVYVDERLNGIRPYIACAIVKGLTLTDCMIRGFMHMQDKLDQTYGRNRRRASIGLYNLDLIKLPLRYTVVKPEEASFVPLGFSEKMNLAEILLRHPKGLEYGHIVKDHEFYPILLDSEGTPLSFPPVINSNDLGRITEDTRNVLVEVTGTVDDVVLNTLKIVTLSLIDRGGKAYATSIHYSKKHSETVTPNFGTGFMPLNVDYVSAVLGLEMTARKVAEMLRRAGHEAEISGTKLVNVRIPCYRIDVMHPVDLVEDVAVAYGYNNIKPVWRELPTSGGMKPEQGVRDISRELMVGMGFQEVLTFTLTNSDNLFAKMNCGKRAIVEISNPKVSTLSCLRNWLLPSLVEFVSNNLHVECPQKIFEVGKVTLPDHLRETMTRDEYRLAAVIYDANASFTEAKATVEAFMRNLGFNMTVEKIEHSTFIEGRVCKAFVEGEDVGFLGEVHPGVLENWGLENPVSALELNIEKIISLKQSGSAFL